MGLKRCLFFELILSYRGLLLRYYKTVVLDLEVVDF
jgi:hypothetical protein